MYHSDISRFQPNPDKHHPWTIALHWGVLLCILVSVAVVLARELIEDKTWRLLLIDAHRQLGLLVLFSVAVRLLLRLRHRMADHLRGMPLAMRLAATATQWSLYGLLVGLPLLGWATTNAHNLPVHFVGLLHLPPLVGEDSELADQLSDWHVQGSWLLLGLVALHATAALYHHYVRRDRVLVAMLPGKAAGAEAGERRRATGDRRGQTEADREWANAERRRAYIGRRFSDAALSA